MSEPDFHILSDGTWLHDGAPIKRDALVKLFAKRALTIDEHGLYWLQTPYEKYEVRVDDVPFLITDYSYDAGVLTLTSNIEETIQVNQDNPLFLKNGIPYIEVRNGLQAKLSRSMLVHLIEQFGDIVESNGQAFKLGEYDE